MLYQAVCDFYPRPPRGGRQDAALPVAQDAKFLSTSPARGTTIDGYADFTRSIFLSTSPARGTTDGTPICASFKRFLSTSPARGTTAGFCRALDGVEQFLSTSPARGTTHGRQHPGHLPRHFYPRPPRGGRLPRRRLMRLWGYFYPRPPRGGRHQQQRDRWCRKKFLSTSPARGTTRRSSFWV